MATLPGIKSSTPYVSDDDPKEVNRRKSFKPDMAKPDADENPFAQFLQDPMPASRVERTETGLWDRFKSHFRASQDYGSVGLDELGKIRDEQVQRDIMPDGSGGVYQQTEADAMADAERLAQNRADRQFEFENMDEADSPMDYLAAVGGSVAGAVIDPMSMVAPEIKVGATAWRQSSPVIAKVLDSGVSNAAANVALNLAVQGEEGLAGVRDEMDWQSILVDAGAGFAFGAPFGYMAGRAQKDEQAAEESLRQLIQTAEADAPPVDNGPRVEAPPPEPATPEQSTVESVSSKHAPDDLAKAQEALFGEVVGTRNLTPQQLNQVDDYLNAGSPYDPNPPEAMPEVRDIPPAQGEPLPQVRESQKPEGGPDAAAPVESAKAPRQTVGDVEVRFPDREHEALYLLGKKVEARTATLGEAKAALKAFKGWVDDSDAPFNNARDAGEMALDYARRVDEEAAKGKTFEAFDMLPNDTARAEWFKRQRMAAAQAEAGPAPMVAGDYQDFRPEELKVDAKRFQYKGGGDAEGVVDTLKKVKSWDRKKSGTIIVWQDKAGNNFVVDGHQRYGLAKRLKGEGQDPVLHAMIWREADGITADEARIMAADINISQGSGTAIDAAKILRARPEFLDNLPNNQVTEHAKGLAKLSDDAFGMVVNGAVPPEYAGLVGKLAPDQTTHTQIMDVLAKNEPASAAQAESMVRDVLAAPEVAATMTDMFGSAEVTQILFKERAQVLSSAVSFIRKDKSAFNMLVKEEKRLSGAGNKLATKTNLERMQSDAEILATLQATARRKGPVADALAAAAKSLHDGTPRQVAVRDFVERVRGEAGGASPDGAGIPPSSQSIAASLGGYRNTDQPAFKRWFGDSKVVDDEGNPLVVHHGGGDYLKQKDFAFDDGKGHVSRHFYFAESADTAEMYGDTVASVYLKVDNPLDITEANINGREFSSLAPEIMRRMDEAGYDLKGMDERRFIAIATSADMYDFQGSSKFQNAFVKAAMDMGFDGVRMDDQFGGDITPVWAVGSPTQIKSIFNRGTWDSSDPRIAFASKPKGPDLFDAPVKNPEIGQTVTGPGNQKGVIKEIFQDQVSVQIHSDGVPNNRALWPVNKITTEIGADKKPQAVLPGAERITDKTLAERKAAAPLQPKRAQKSMDFGMFGSEKDQIDLVDMVNRQATLFKVKGEGDYLDFTPSGTIEDANIGGVSVKYTARDGEVEIVSIRTRLQDRKNGLAKAALGEFLRKADDEGLAVRALAKPTDKATTGEGLEKLLTSFGFVPSGRVAKEFIRRGPSVADQNLRALDDSLDSLVSLVDADADIDEIASHPFIQGAVRRMEALPLTDAQPGFMSDTWKANRTYAFPGKEIKGYDNAVAELVEMAKDFSTNGPVRRERKATIMLGPPAAGKSTIAEKFATVRHAAIVDPDEAKKVIPEFARGIGANAVHEESALMAADVMDGLLNEGANLVIPRVGQNAKGIRKLIENLKSEGYQVDLVNVNVTYDNAFRRMVRRFVKTGRLINPAYVKAVGELPAETYRLLREQGVATRYAEINGNGKTGQAPEILDDTGATEGIPGLGGSRGQGTGDDVPAPPEAPDVEARPDPLFQDGGEWRNVTIKATLDDGATVDIPAGEAIDLLVRRRKSLAELLECVNAA